MIQQRVAPDNLIFIQSRAEINLSVVEEYAEMMAEGVVFDPVEGLQGEDGTIWVWDGYHRGEAAKKSGTMLLVNLRPGSRIEAEWLALTANQKHGLRRSRADKQRVVRQALRHPYGVNLSNSEIGRHCGVTDKTVAKIRREMEASSEIPKIDKRIVTRSGVTYKQDISNIGSAPAQSEEVPPSERIVPARSSEPAETRPPDHRYPADSPFSYEPTAQEFECPRCGLERIVGRNGSRRWCLACDAEWPTAQAFLAEVNLQRSRQPGQGPTRAELQSRFGALLARLDEAQLVELAAWLDRLERRLTQSQPD
jgi:hypothetical protein